ncbi:hypothetical protein [Pseudomonas sp. H9]|uniref:hypothetical protein n=1 Tax=Pseudomonas sp. H9 TaxID=483968 RepID=UPI001057D051|nr:hypothetical protein [Pseudomonas sp. H9]TDF83909.1 hypothetical protein E1573_09170 [Pseudomonas sp. H9]
MKNSNTEISGSVLETQALPNYRLCLPAELHSQADAFIQYLRELPDWAPEKCPYCAHPHLKREIKPNLSLPSYLCGMCNGKVKNPLARYVRTHLWPIYGHYLLAGWPTQATADAMDLTEVTASNWVEPFRAVMAKEFPALYQWWAARQDRTCLEPPAHIAAQAQAFLDGIAYYLTTEHADCPTCGSPDMRRINQRRPDFYCPGCGNSVSLLRGTLLHRMGYPQHWLTFAQALINGERSGELQRRTGFCAITCRRWRSVFMKLIEQQGHSELIEWITWLRSHRAKR